MRSVLLAIVVALCAVLTPAVSTASVGAPPPKSKTSVPKEETPREERETSRLRVLVAPDRESALARPSSVTAIAPQDKPRSVPVSSAEPLTVWRTPPALQVFRN
ncbi:hypothetical protein [Lentzea sp.]|uniref:hypothetical protein n=1 Tax=Lentzea sp. TaxID=56099 RepID=UPI002C3F274E|nr:hypothetical protein [Lentzea sp.]HUQ55464.1 hypothetical protein [Lentzea sp.]